MKKLEKSFNTDFKEGLAQKLRDKILNQGPITFECFMGLCLYDEVHGFYRKRQVLGKKGHFFTNIQVSHLYGQLIAQQLLEMWEVMDKPDSFSVFEQGAHDGQLAIDILRWCRDFVPHFFEALNYGIIESWKEGQLWQREKAKEAKVEGKLRHFSDIKEIASHFIRGVFLSHELVDSFPVHRVIYCGGQWQEIYVSWEEDKGFYEIFGALSSEELVETVKQWPLPAVEGYQTEISLAAKVWMNEVSHRLKQGFVMTIDYGFSEKDYYSLHRSSGTLRAYYHHKSSERFYEFLGEQDLTAHVNFSLLKREGELQGLRLVGFTDQGHFLTGIAKEDLLALEKKGVSASQKWVRAFQMLTHPNLMGLDFKVLCQSKNLPEVSLKGFQWKSKML